MTDASTLPPRAPTVTSEVGDATAAELESAAEGLDEVAAVSEVAKHLGVSHQRVSALLNDDRPRD